MTDRKNWKTRLVLRIQSDIEGQFDITPLENFTPSFRTPHRVIHSTEDQNLGFERGNWEFNFNFTVLAIGDVVEKLTRMQLTGDEFSIVTQVADESEDWSFVDGGLSLNKCVLTDGGGSPAQIDGTPRVSFNGLALEVSFSDVEYGGIVT